jgi:hypothetical protein
MDIPLPHGICRGVIQEGITTNSPTINYFQVKNDILHREKDVILGDHAKEDSQQPWGLHLLLEPRMTMALWILNKDVPK